MIKKLIITLSICLAFLYFSGCGKHNPQEASGNSKKGIQGGKPGPGRGEGSQIRNRRRGNKAETPAKENVIYFNQEVQKQIDIKTVKAKSGAVVSSLKAMGKVLAPNDKKAIVSFTFSARIVGLHQSVGQWVNQGDPLISLECEEVGNAQSELVKALTDCQLAKLDFDREDRLFKKDIGAKKDYLETKARHQICSAALKAAEKKLIVLGLSKKQIEEIARTRNVSPRITVRAPLAGRVVRNNAVLGAVIDASTEIMVIMDLESLWIDAEIFEKDLSKVIISQNVEIVVPAYPREIFKGKIHYIGDEVNSETRTITVRTKVMNKDFKLKPGMFADITILTGQRKHAIIVPKAAVLDDGNDKIVFVQKGDSFICRFVRVGTKYNGEYEILKGLKVGEMVVTEGNHQLKSKLHEGSISHSHTH